jgi:hypothetical protein
MRSLKEERITSLLVGRGRTLTVVIEHKELIDWLAAGGTASVLPKWANGG